jgi:hypothetical protein
MLVFCVANPALVINELILGQRIFRAIHSCIRCDMPELARQYVNCPACGRWHPYLLWHGLTGLGHWFGLFCPDCGARIPTLLNIVTIPVAAVTTPLWWPIWRLIRPRWIEWEKRRVRRKRYRRRFRRSVETNWIRTGVIYFGGFMWLSVSAFHAIRQPVNRQFWLDCLSNLPFCLFGGLVFGLLMKLFAGRRHRYKKGHCRNCGYSLHGLPKDICPECGFRFDPADREQN